MGDIFDDAAAINVHLKTQKALNRDESVTSKNNNIGWYAWSTKDEIRLLRKLGIHSNVSEEDEVRRITPRKSRFELLLLYEEAMNNRVDWGDIEPVEVGEVLERMIIEERRKRKRRGKK